MESPMVTITLPLSQVAALQAAGQHYVKTYNNSPILADVAAGVESLDAPFKFSAR